MLQSEGHQVTVLSRNEYGDFLAPTYAPSDAVSQLTACDAALILAGCFELNAAFARMVQVNALGPARVANAIHGRFPYAHIITFLDSRIGRPKTALPPPIRAYLASKRRLAHWTLAAARCWGRKTGTRVNAIAPGFFLTEQNRTLLTNPDGSWTQRGQDVIRQTPFGRMGRPEELCGTIQYLISDASSFVTGTVAVVDGGFNVFAM